MLRAAAGVLVAILGGVPLTVLAGPPVSWLVVWSLVVGGAGVAVLSVPVVTAGAVLALMAYTLALVIVQPPVDPVVAIAMGVAPVVLLPLVHFAGRAQGADVGRGVIVAQLRQWLATAAAGVLVAGALTAGAAALGASLGPTSLPVAVAASALGSLLVVAGAITLVMPPGRPAAPAGRDEHERR